MFHVDLQGCTVTLKLVIFVSLQIHDFFDPICVQKKRTYFSDTWLKILLREEIRLTSWYGEWISQLFTWVLCIPNGCLGFLNHQQYLKRWWLPASISWVEVTSKFRKTQSILERRIKFNEGGVFSWSKMGNKHFEAAGLRGEKSSHTLPKIFDQKNWRPLN